MTFCECSLFFPIYVIGLEVIYFWGRIKLKIKIDLGVDIKM